MVYDILWIIFYCSTMRANLSESLMFREYVMCVSLEEVFLSILDLCAINSNDWTHRIPPTTRQSLIFALLCTAFIWPIRNGLWVYIESCGSGWVLVYCLLYLTRIYCALYVDASLCCFRNPVGIVVVAPHRQHISNTCR